MPTGVSWKKDERRQHRAVLKYKKVEGDKWSIDTSKDRGAVRPIDLVSRDPDRLREHVTIEAAVAFEEECYKEAERLKAIGCDWSQYRYIPRRQLNIPEDHRQLHDSLVGEISDGNRDVTEIQARRYKQGEGKNKVSAEPKIIEFFPHPDGTYVQNERGFYVDEEESPADAQKYKKVRTLE